MATNVLQKEASQSKHWHGVAAEIKNRLKKIQDNVTKFESGPADESINKKQQQQYAETRLSYIMAYAKQKFMGMLCEEEMFVGEKKIKTFESTMANAQLNLRDISKHRVQIGQQATAKIAEVQTDISLTAAKLDAINGKINNLNKENANSTNMSANAELNKQLESGQEEIAKLEQEKKVHQTKLLDQESTRQQLRRQLTALKGMQEEATAMESSSVSCSNAATPSSMDQKNMTRWYQELNAYLSRVTGVSISQDDFACSATDGCRRLKLTLFNSHIMDIGFAPTGGIASIQLSPDNIYHADIDEATLTSERSLEQSRLRWVVSEYCRRVSRAGRLRKACTSISNKRCFVGFDAIDGKITLSLKSEGHSDVVLTCKVSRVFAERLDTIMLMEIQSQDLSQEQRQTLLGKIKQQGPFHNISNVAKEFSGMIDSVL